VLRCPRSSAQLPAGSRDTPEAIAYAAFYVASDEAKCVNGINLVVDGGTTVLI
jgi:hypothetical protein